VCFEMRVECVCVFEEFSKLILVEQCVLYCFVLTIIRIGNTAADT
jgi:hypothetical protein